MKRKLVSIEQALAPVVSGSTVALGGSLLRRQPNAAVRELIRRGVKELRLLTWATTTATDMLAAAGCLSRLEGIYAGLCQYGMAPNVRRGVESGAIEVRDFSESAMVARFRAAGMGLPFLPTRAMLGTDMAADNPDQVRPIACPFTGLPMHAIAAAEADFTILHGYVGDAYGNVQWPVVRDTDDIDPLMAKAARRLIVTVERIVPHEQIASRPTLTYIPHIWVEAIAEVPYGAHPVACDGFYDEDHAHLELYVERNRTAAGARAYLEAFVEAPRDHAGYLERIGGAARLGALAVAPTP